MNNRDQRPHHHGQHPQRGHHPQQRGDYHSHHENHHPPPEQPPKEARHGEPARWHSFKLLVDPTIHHSEKMVRFDGTTVPGNPHHISPSCSDPRKRPHGLSVLWKRLEAMDLPVPRFAIDENYIGDPPPVEVTVDNLNDNIDKQFLHNMVIKYGELEELEIDYHPLSKKHLGLARLVFKSVRASRECVSALHGKSVMGKQLNCYLDPRGVMAAKMFQDLTTDRKPSPPPPPPEPEPPEEEEEPPPPEDNYRQDDNWDGGRRWDWEETRDSWGRDRDRGRDRDYDDYSSRHDKRDKRGRDRWKRRDADYDHHSSRDADNSMSHDTGHYDYYNNVNNDWKPPQDQGGEYWSQTASSYAATTSYSDVAAKEEPVEKKESGSESERHVDLDTRLKMLMKDKSGGMPAFLLGATTSDEEEKPQVPIPAPSTKPDDPILERTPSPFRDRNAYINCYWITRRQDEMAQVNSALASYNHLTMDPHKRPFSRTSDKMSLSSLSPDHKIHQEEPNYIPPPNNQYGFAPGYGFNPFPGQPYGSVPWYGERSQQDPYSLQYGVPGPGPGSGQFDQYNDNYQWNNEWDQSGEEVKESEKKKNKFSGKDPKDRYRGLIDSVVSIVEAELKKTLKKDINKKMCETLAFMLFDQWWNEQERKFKEKLAKETKKSSAPTIGRLPDREKVEALPRIPKPEDLSSLIDKQRESLTGSASTFGLGGSLGLGRLGAIPKLKKAAQPIRPPEPKWANKKKHKHKEKSRDEKDEEDEDETDFKVEREKERQARKDKKKEKKEKESPKKSKDDTKDKTTVESLYSAIYGDSDDEEEGKKPKEEESSEVSESEPEIKKKDKSSPDTSDSSGAESSSAASSESSSSSSASSDSSDDEGGDKKAKKRSSSSDSSSSSSSSKSASPSKSRSRSKSRTPVRLKSKSRSRSRSSEVEAKSEVHISPPSTPTTAPKEKSPVKKEKSVSPVQPKKTPQEKKKSKPVVEGSETETDNETEENKAEESSAAQALMSLASSKVADSSPVVHPSPVKVQYLQDAASPPHIMDHCYAKPVARKERKDTQSSVSEQEQQRSYADHDYARPSSPSPAITERSEPAPPSPVKTTVVSKRGRKPGHGHTRPQLPVQPVKFRQREIREQYEILYKFLTAGIDNEDIAYLKRSYDMMLLDNQPGLAWINDTHWVDHPATCTPDPPKKKRRMDDFSKVHKTGSARTEGYYKMDPREKARTKYHFHRTGVDAFSTERKEMDKLGKQQKAISASREARSQQRRMLTALGDDAIESDLLKFNQLKFRRKAMKFGKSAIHDWGLFALEAIGADEMVIEYVGAVVRPLLSDIREKRYEKQGIGSSYLFRIDLEYVVDATKCGNLARFVNHSCDPNCYAKIIKIDGQSKIVIYSKQPIALGEEITYDYKFPIEDEKIRCLCASKNCRKYLN